MTKSRIPTPPQRVVLASGNPGKVTELQAVLQGQSLEVVPQSRFDVPAVEETGLSFVENALIKARHCALHTGMAVIADDSGLVVDALDGAPGIYSSRYAGDDTGDAGNLRKLLAEMAGIAAPRRTARFYCALVFLRHARDPMPIICEGLWEGSILEAPRGRLGFGYDPLFYVPDHDCSAAEMAPEIKTRVSHRGQALARLMRAMGVG